MFINTDDLFLINKMKNNARGMTRKLLISIVGEEKLKTMTLTGRGKDKHMTAIPKNVLNAVEGMSFIIYKNNYN